MANAFDQFDAGRGMRVAPELQASRDQDRIRILEGEIPNFPDDPRLKEELARAKGKKPAVTANPFDRFDAPKPGPAVAPPNAPAAPALLPPELNAQQKRIIPRATNPAAPRAGYNPMNLPEDIGGSATDQAAKVLPPWAAAGVGTAANLATSMIPFPPGGPVVKGAVRGAERLLRPGFADEGMQAAGAIAKPPSIIDVTRKAAQEAGYITPPESGLKAAAAGLAGKAKIEKMISEKNAENASKRLAKDVDIPDGAPLSMEEIKNQKSVAGAVYDSMPAAAGPKLKVSSQFKSSLQDALTKIEEEIAFNPVANEPLKPAQRLLKSFVDQTEFDSTKTLRAIKRQRSLAKGDFREGDTEMGTARMAISNQLENLFQDNLAESGQGAIVDNFKAAREKFAKLYLLERITNESTGKVDLSKLAALSESKQYKGTLTGEFKTASDFAKAYRKAAQKSMGEAAPRLSVFDGMFALGSLASGHPGLAATEIGGRLVIPALAERGLLQNRTKGAIPPPP